MRIIAKHYGKLITLQDIRELSETTRAGSNLMMLNDAAEAIGFKSLGVKLDFNKLKEAPLPLIVHWNKNHFLVVYKIKKDVVYISDPSYGLITYKKDEFIPRWMGNNAKADTKEGIALLLEVTPKFKQLAHGTHIVCFRIMVEGINHLSFNRKMGIILLALVE